MNRERIIVTGASGFIGSFIVEEALKRGMDVWAAIRKGSSLRYLQYDRIHFVELDFSSESQMTAALQRLQFDYAVHAAGATKALRQEQFYKVNTDGTVNFVRSVEKTSPSLKRLVFISSLSIFGAVRDRKPYTDILLTDTPQPNTTYGRSKLKAEQWLRENATVPYTILRPTGVYGPREQDYKMMADSIRKHVDFASGWTRQDITFVYVRDVVQAVFKSMKSEKTVGKAYFLSDGEVYDSSEFSRLLINQLGVKWVVKLRMPLCLLKIVCAVCDAWSHVSGKMTTLNNDHYNILAQRNWRCDIQPAIDDFGFLPEWKLADGVKETFQLTVNNVVEITIRYIED